MDKLIFQLFPIFCQLVTAEFIEIHLDNGTVLNKIGLDHPYVCANFDWWPDSKVNSGMALF